MRGGCHPGFGGQRDDDRLCTQLPGRTPGTALCGTSRSFARRRVAEGLLGVWAGSGLNLFVSHAGADRAWVAWEPPDAGYTVSWMYGTGGERPELRHRDKRALARADRVVALLSYTRPVSSPGDPSGSRTARNDLR
jgi:hypothetical protein